MKKFLIAAAFAALTPGPAAADYWEFSSSLNYDTGKYGSNESVDSLYIPLTLRRCYPGANLSVTVPYLRQSSTGEVTRIDGQPARTARGDAGGTGTQAGLGDILLSGSYALREDGPGTFGLAVTGRLKLPTASRDKGLGTGAVDETGGLEFSKEVTPRWTLLADGYYTIVGDTGDEDFDNQIAVDLGVFRPLRDNVSLVVLYETRNAIISGGSDPRSVSGTLNYSSPSGVRFNGGLALGLSDGSPAIALSAGFSRKF